MGSSVNGASEVTDDDSPDYDGVFSDGTWSGPLRMRMTYHLDPCPQLLLLGSAIQPHSDQQLSALCVLCRQLWPLSKRRRRACSRIFVSFYKRLTRGELTDFTALPDLSTTVTI